MENHRMLGTEEAVVIRRVKTGHSSAAGESHAVMRRQRPRHRVPRRGQATADSLGQPTGSDQAACRISTLLICSRAQNTVRSLFGSVTTILFFPTATHSG